ncbi:MAG: 4Fe-4S binding protein [Clostridiales bacterium]|nr:4Fe-4S binding protein [Clostridiales bacterium]
MKRKIITIDEEKCNGCGLCVDACHEGAIALVDGKAKLISESYCDGLGACLPHCPADAIAIEEREAEAFDEEYAIRHQQEKLQKKEAPAPQPAACNCPGSRSRAIARASVPPVREAAAESQLAQWPCQIKLVPVNAPFFHRAHLLIAASCTAYAYANVHGEFMRGRVTLIGCPKLDGADYSEKLAEILRANDIRSITVLRMEVPCCGGIVTSVKNAIIQSGEMIPWHMVTLSTDGRILED